MRKWYFKKQALALLTAVSVLGVSVMGAPAGAVRDDGMGFFTVKKAQAEETRRVVLRDEGGMTAEEAARRMLEAESIAAIEDRMDYDGAYRSRENMLLERIQREVSDYHGLFPWRATDNKPDSNGVNVINGSAFVYIFDYQKWYPIEGDNQPTHLNESITYQWAIENGTREQTWTYQKLPEEELQYQRQAIAAGRMLEESYTEYSIYPGSVFTEYTDGRKETQVETKPIWSGDSAELTTTTEYPDGHKEIVVTRKNEDGTETTTERTENPEGSTGAQATQKPADGGNDQTGATEHTETRENPDGSRETVTTRENPDGSKETESVKENTDGTRVLSSETVRADGTSESSEVVIDTGGNVTGITTSEKTATGTTTIPYRTGSEGCVNVEKITTTEETLSIPSTITPADGNTYQVTEISGSAMKANQTVKKLEMGNYIKKIGKAAFENCAKLKSVSFSKALKTLSEGAFRGCTGLTGVSLPDSVTSVGKACFKNCKSMKKFTLGKVKKGGAQNTGNGTAWGKLVKISIGASALQGCSNLKEVIISSGVTEIGNAAFKQCKKLVKVIIYSVSLKIVGKQALKGVHDCKIHVMKKKLKSYKILFKNKGQGKKVIVAKI